jgi:hypothetical protein
VTLQSKVLAEAKIVAAGTTYPYTSPANTWTNLQDVLISVGPLSSAGAIYFGPLRGADWALIYQAVNVPQLTTIHLQGKWMLNPADQVRLDVGATLTGNVLVWLSGQTYT